MEIDAKLGSPDGLTVDADGGVWVAVYGGGQVHRYTPAGVLDTIVMVPDATQTTSMGFGGPELDTLFVTTAREHLDPVAEAVQPNAGGILAVRPGTVGQATASFTL